MPFRTMIRLNLLVLCGLMASGCATGNMEDDRFFNRGWVWPTELDEPPAKSQPVDDAMPPLPPEE